MLPDGSTLIWAGLLWSGKKVGKMMIFLVMDIKVREFYFQSVKFRKSGKKSEKSEGIKKKSQKVESNNNFYKFKAVYILKLSFSNIYAV